ncbi:MAG: peptide-methionine (S)-S-oxide reductase MsrA [Planctomycetes bacterium]|nr:peptide-methionine (S)-S-oxide reductase MsrA [Planctomycetota bacterium]
MSNSTLQLATLGGGCFWCLEAVFEQLRGVHKVVSGYSGGVVPNATYDEVCTGRTGHAEVIEVTFDSAEISFADLLDVFFATHDPTTLNRQGADAGTQYRSVIFCHDDVQQRVAIAKIEELNAAKLWNASIVTEVARLEAFYAAEDYHQGYYRLHPGQGYCQAVISPKVSKFRQNFAHRLRG